MEEKTWSVWSIFRDDISELIKKNPGLNKTEIARQCMLKNNVSFTFENVEGLRRYVSRHYEALGGVSEPSSNHESMDTVTGTSTNQYESQGVLSARKPSGGIMSAREFCDFYGLPFQEARSYKLITHLKYPTYNIASHDINAGSSFSVEDYEAVLDRFFKKPYVAPEVQDFPKIDGDELISRLVISDVHIGMGYPSVQESTYEAKWDEDEINKRLCRMIAYVRLNKRESNTVIVDDLGDFMDNYNGYTTRGGHQVPQGMSTMDAFDLALSFKIKLAVELKDEFDCVVFNNVCNDNHGGVLSYLVNSAFQRSSSNSVIVNNHRKFMSHYNVGRHSFILCHGKDSKYMKYPMKPHPDKNDLGRVEEYMRMNGIGHDRFVEFSKGDSHLGVFDFSSSDTFDYISYPAFSPSSDWVVHNYKVGQSGFVFQQFHLDEKYKAIHYFRY